jgi:hypothetical protein
MFWMVCIDWLSPQRLPEKWVLGARCPVARLVQRIVITSLDQYNFVITVSIDVV